MHTLVVRIVSSAMIWVISYPAVYMSVAPAYAVLERGLTDEAIVDKLPLMPFIAFGTYSWFVLLAMNVAWVVGKRVPRWVPISGTLAAIVVLGGWLYIADGNIFVLLWALPAIVFAIGLCVFHLY